MRCCTEVLERFATLSECGLKAVVGPRGGGALKIESFEIDGLLGRADLQAPLDSDLAILTGRNGAGKTSVLKLLWSIISGNILIGLEEVEFKRARVVTDEYDCTVHRTGRRTCVVDFSVDGETFRLEDDDDDEFGLPAETQANQRLTTYGSSLFFPTFRRIEGGFSIARSQQVAFRSSIARQARARSDLEQALQAISVSLSNEPHMFVSAISTSDIVTLLLRQYATLSDQSNRSQAQASQEIIQLIRRQQRETRSPEADSKLIEDVLQRVTTLEDRRNQIMTPWEKVSELVQQVFKNTGIKLDSRMSFGDAATAVDSNLLSAGEKQMLSFVCYNAFYRNSIIFIDEPELSLHPDWQRQLFSILQRQKTSNQFIVATHSPFIYAKYPEKEIGVIVDRGDTDRDH